MLGPPYRKNVPKYYGKWRGIVVQVDEQKDISEGRRQQRGRIRATVPALFGARSLTEWALPSYPLAGGRAMDADRKEDEFGVFYVPTPGDLVWIEFEQGDIRKPVWSGGYFPQKTDGTMGIPRLARGEDDGTAGAPELNPSSNYNVGPSGTGSDFLRAQANPPIADPNGTDYAAKYPWNIVFKSRSGIIVEIDDTKGATRLRLRHPSGSQLQFRHNGDVKMFAAKDMVLVAHNNMVLKAPSVKVGAGDLMGEVLTKLTQPACMVTGIPFGFSNSVKANS